MKFTIFDKLIVDNSLIEKKDFWDHYSKFKNCLQDIDGKDIDMLLDFKSIRKTLIPTSKIEDCSSIKRELNGKESEFISQLKEDIEPLWRSSYSVEKIEKDYFECASCDFVQKLENNSYTYKPMASDLNLNLDLDLLKKVDSIVDVSTFFDLGILFKIKAAHSIANIFTSNVVCYKFAMVFGIGYFFSFLHSIFYSSTKKVLSTLIDKIIAGFYTKRLSLSTRMSHMAYSYRYSVMSVGLLTTATGLIHFNFKSFFPQNRVLPETFLKNGFLKTVLNVPLWAGYFAGSIPSSFFKGFFLSAYDRTLEIGKIILENKDIIKKK